MAELLADADAVATYTQDWTLPPDAVEQALTVATALVQAATAQHLFYVEDDPVLLAWNATGRYVLPERPVQAVSAVQFRGHFPASTYDLQAGQWALSPHGVLELYAPWQLPGPIYRGATVAATYTHGFSEIPADLQAVAVGIAVRCLHKPREAYSEDLGEYVQPGSTAGPAHLTDMERKVCNRYRRMTWGSA